MEPFFLRCETCHARLKVRDEQFLGQVQSCPKCGSMVQILAPAGWLATDEATPTPDAAEVAATAAAPAILTRAATLLGEHPAVGRPVPALRCLVTGVVAVFALSGNNESAALPPATVAVATKVVEPDESAAASRAGTRAERNDRRSRAARSSSGHISADSTYAIARSRCSTRCRDRGARTAAADKRAGSAA